MLDRDLNDFAALLDGVCSLLSRGAYQPNATNTALFFGALRRYDLATVRAGFNAHVADPKHGRFVPTPADVIGQIEGMAAKDGRPEADEAWAIALRCADEAATVVWTEEAAHAWAIARPVLDMGDEVGARMAFKAAYARCVDEARATRTPTSWTVSLGFDASQRDSAITQAVAVGRLDQSLLPAPSGSVAGLLELSQARGCPPEIKARLDALRESLTSRGDYDSEDFLQKQLTAARKEQINEQVQARLRQDGENK